ncbi:hypothetical protein [Anaerobutyricum soehngenii]|uniref:hypothetical protein n=1 Tax=Anaerobutyricum soehngenii TaxID=105843 RepID=UPI001C122103|nr:hypothetical protein [Anaerobutyricum soehngenii]MBU5417686.1 hypothetical protein [Anaerobutyricum soehngenii]
MNKKNVLWLLLDLVFLVIFNVVFFVLGGTEHPASVWISYGFIHFSYIMLMITPKLIRKSSSSAVFGFSLYSISSAYFLIAFIVGVIFVFVRSESYKVSLVSQVIIAGLYLIMLISHMIANEHTADSIERHEMELQYVKESSAKIKGIMGSVEDRKLKKQIEKVYDLIHGSQTKSNNAARDYELTVMDLLEVLEQNIKRNDLVAASTTLDKIIKNAEERNRRVRLGN